ncbi:MAG TPA: hypothetical protein VFU00_11190 [Gemmatimonadales bacterium]|nr:hypothetical protein [Gemmatimonadales bacterium]
MRFTLRPALALGTILLLAAPLAAARAQEPTPPAVRAGDEAVDGRRLSLGSSSYRLVMRENGKELGGATIRIVVSAADAAGEAGLLIVKTVESPRGTIFDTSLVRRRTLQPVWHHSTQPTRRMRLDFRADSVTGAVTPNEGAPVPVAHGTAEPTFDSAVLEQVIGSLPLAAGYAARIPFYIHEAGGLVWYGVRVAGEESVTGFGGQPAIAWRVAVDAMDRTVTSWFDRASGAWLRTETSMGPGRSMVIGPLPEE